MPRTNTAQHPFHQKGFTFLETMLVVAIIGILVAIAVPLYSEYSKQAHLNNAAQKAAHLQMLLDDYWEDNGTYISGSGSDTAFQTALGWHPGDNDTESTVIAGSTGSITTSYTITTTHKGESVVITHAQ